jgi:hypothetical protein
MADVGIILENEEGNISDVYEFATMPKSMFADTEFYHIEKKTYVPISGDVFLNFGMLSGVNEEDIQTYSNDDPRLKYHFLVATPVLPTIKLNSFSFTNKKGETIPSILYYRTDGRVVHIIDNFPAIFTNDIKKDMRHRSFIIFAECSQSYAATKTIYINYDIEVGNKRFIRKAKYREKWYIDWRPTMHYK